jgi:hypothetical protein
MKKLRHTEVKKLTEGWRRVSRQADSGPPLPRYWLHWGSKKPDGS